MRPPARNSNMRSGGQEFGRPDTKQAREPHNGIFLFLARHLKPERAVKPMRPTVSPESCPWARDFSRVSCCYISPRRADSAICSAARYANA